MPKIYPEVEANPSFSNLEQEVLKRWKTQDTFKKSLRGNDEFVFYDGPPFANGLPHYGHLLTGFIKDLVARYQTMKGKKVERRFGWDCHGLPAEMEAEKTLNISGRIAIEEYGISKFNEHCKNSVMKYTKEWEEYVTRQGRWVDFENDYKTMDLEFMESVIWAFKTLYEKGLLYESTRVLPYSWACQTPVSDFETKMDNAYREKASKAITVVFNLKTLPAGYGLEKYKGVKMVAWTTTPWTLPSNLALAVGEEIDYAAILQDEHTYILGDATYARYKKELGAEKIATIPGKDLQGLIYEPLFKYFEGHDRAFQVLTADFVTTEDGTGIVHIAPGFGEDDHELCKKHNIDVVCPVDEGGRFVYPVTDFIDMQVFDANDEIIKALKLSGNWLATEQYLHNYPHCWRTDTPLIYKAVPSWYLKVTAIKDDLIRNNQQINWIPEHIKNGLFGKWLENTRDWSISRNRFWGCPIPVWRSDNPEYPHIEVYGSLEEISKAFGVKVNDLHRPFIDTLVKPNPKDPTGKSMMRRVADVLDCWFESGSMPYAQVHYPFENKEWFENNFPADFIVEYVAQTRGWFYTLLVLSTALFNRPPFLNCICHGVILGDGGQKLSKRLKNYADPKEVFATLGADALRWLMVSSPVMRGNEISIDKDAKSVKEVVRLVLKPIWNAYHFFTLYANADEIKAEFSFESENIMDRYILQRCLMTTETIDKALEDYDTPTATMIAEKFFEILNNWYIRRSRERFWKSEKDADKISAYNTLYTVLHIMCKALAPLLPMLTESIFLGLCSEKADNGSVHLELFPKYNFNIDYELIELMERVMDACNAALFLRNELKIRIRQPMANVTFIGVAGSDISDDFKQLILDEINVKTWTMLDKSEILKYADYKLQIIFKVLAKRVPDKIKDILAANQQGKWQIENSKVIICGITLQPDEFELKLLPKPEFASRIASLSSNDALVMLDTELSRELLLEGIARDIVRFVQQGRKVANLNITDRIHLVLVPQGETAADAVKTWKGYIMEQTLALSAASSFSDGNKVYEGVLNLEDQEVKVEIYV